ncbi:unnamed protein product [Blepharisma stoltei]|uniref:AB hydrolase-1 domain-containing protein n=1 Tax=Blepharisma stoltei TaxID=1481888 RepID=A0AAU9JG76_9CILI|nr:unnamed protein product [Blepharisma stoltei]
MFFKILKFLTEHYRIYCLDLIGMGRSSRPVFKANGYSECESFFIIPIEICREYLGIEKMILAGHSFGGYIAGCYAEAYPQRVEKLIMISPAGISKPTEEYDFERFLESKNWFVRILIKSGRYLFNRNVNPATLLRKIGPFGGRFIKNYLKRRIIGLTKIERKYLKIYFEQVNLCPGSGEYALPKIMKELLYPHAPLCDRLKNIPIVFLFGDQDWMSSQGAHQNKEVNQSNVIIETVSNAGHQLYLDNPKETAEKIIAGISKLSEPKT